MWGQENGKGCGHEGRRVWGLGGVGWSEGVDPPLLCTGSSPGAVRSARTEARDSATRKNPP